MKLIFTLICALFIATSAVGQDVSATGHSTDEIIEPKYKGADNKYYMGRLVGEMMKIAERNQTPADALSTAICVRIKIDTLGAVSVVKFLNNQLKDKDYRDIEPATQATQDLLFAAIDTLGEFTPAIRNGRKISYNQTMRLAIPVRKLSKKQEADPLLFMGVDPDISFRKWAAKRARYDYTLTEKGIEGLVHARFYIEPNGSISSIEIMESTNAKLSKEVVRLVKASKKFWTPRKVRGVAQRTPYEYKMNFINE